MVSLFQRTNDYQETEHNSQHKKKITSMIHSLVHLLPFIEQLDYLLSPILHRNSCFYLNVKYLGIEMNGFRRRSKWPIIQCSGNDDKTSCVSVLPSMIEMSRREKIWWQPAGRIDVCPGLMVDFHSWIHSLYDGHNDWNRPLGQSLSIVTVWTIAENLQERPLRRMWTFKSNCTVSEWQ